MALIICPECGKEVSSSATICPNCGYKVKKHLNAQQIALQKNKLVRFLKSKELIGAAGLFLMGALIFLFVSIAKGPNGGGVIHGIKWGMSVAQVERLEKKYGTGKTSRWSADAENIEYYSVDESTYYNRDVNIRYKFENNKLVEIWLDVRWSGSFIGDKFDIVDSRYHDAIGIAFDVCKQYGLPVSFEDNTGNHSEPCAILSWNAKGTIISVKSDFTYRTASYSFLLTPYEGDEIGKRYSAKGQCDWGKAVSRCENEIIPWGGSCYIHGCCVMGCRYSMQNASNKEPLCTQHQSLLPDWTVR